MTISKEHIRVRNDIARDIGSLLNILQDKFPTAELGSLNAAISKLKGNKVIKCPYKDLNPSHWGYNVSKIVFKLDSGFPKKIKPSEVDDLKLIINIHAVGHCDSLNTMEDPLEWLAIEFRIEGEVIKNDDIVKVFTCYHLDRHIIGEEDGKNEPHPFYHFQFGGKNLINKNGGLDTGDLIVVETPRITHHPMDLILGMDYLISYFFPKKRKDLIKKNKEYSLLLKKYQNIILKPYFHTLSSHWKYERDIIVQSPLWSPVAICPQLI